MEANEIRLIALVNRLADAFYPNPDDADPVGPWGPWIKEALLDGPFPEPWKQGPLPDPWHGRSVASMVNGYWWQDDHPGPPPYWKAALRDIASFVSLNPQPLPPRYTGIAFARNLATVALRRAHDVGGEQGGSLLHSFSKDWCGNEIKIPTLSRPVPTEPRPPRPEESLVLGAALIRAAGSSDVATVAKAGKEAGSQIFQHGFSGLG